MSDKVDNKVVKMTFDNSAFQRNVSQTMSSLDALKKSLDFKGVGNVLKTIGDSAGRVDLSPIHTQVEGVNTGFLALATVAAAVLSGITTKAVAAGASMVKALTLTPAIKGFQEYETNMNSVQTILANTQSKGTTLDQVNASLDQMNEYSDKTIYNFSQMAKNVGTFTAAGVDLETSVKSIKGIANLAALSGSSSEQASNAMYQLSQEIASGSVKLMGWNSVVQAGMGGEQFKNALVQTGQALGELTKQPVGQTFKEWEAANGIFRDTLKDGWVTADVLTTTLGALSGDLSAVQMSDMGFTDEQVVQMQKLGETARNAATEVKTATQLISTVKESLGSAMALSFRTVIGDFVEAKTLYTNLNNFIGGFISRSSEARNKLLAEWKWFGGREQLMGGLMATLGSLQSILKPIGAAFREVFPKKTAEDLYNITKAFREFAERMLLSENGAKRLKQIFTGVFSILSIGVAIVKGVFSVFKALATVFFDIIGGFAGATGSAGDFISKIRELLVDKGGIANFFKLITDNIYRLGGIVLWVRERLAGVFDFVKDKTAGKFAVVVDTVSAGFAKLGDAASVIVSKIPEAKQAIENFFTSLYDGFMSTDFGATVKETLATVTDFFTSIYKTITGVDIGAEASKAFSGVTDFFYDLWDKVNDWVSLSSTLEDIRDSFTTFFSGLFDSTKSAGQGFSTSLSSIGEAIGEFIGNLWSTMGSGVSAIGDALGNIFSSMFESIKSAGGPIGDAIAGFMDTIKDGLKPENLNKILTLVGTGILVSLTRSFKRLSKNGIDFNFIPADLVESLTDTLGKVQGAIKSFQNNLRADTLMKIAIAMAVLTASIVVLSLLDPNKIGIALGAVAVGIASLVAALALLSKIEANPAKTTALGLSILLTAAAVLVLAAAVAVFGNMDTDVLKKGLLSVSIALIVLAGSAALMSKANGSILRAAFAIGIIGISLIILAQAIKYFANMDLGTLLKGGYIITGILISLAVLSNIVDGTAFQRFSIGLGLASLSLWGLSEVIKKFADIPFWAMIQGIIGMAAVLALVIISLKSMPDEKKSKASTVALLGMSVALWIMSKAVETIGKMSTGGVIQGVLALVVVLGLLVAATLLLNYFGANVGPILTLSVALAIFAGAIYLLGQLDVGQVLIALGAIAGLFLVIGGATLLLTPILPLLAALGLTLLLAGAGFALFGAGLALTAFGLTQLDKVGPKAIQNFGKVLVEIIKVIPKVAAGLAEGFVEFVKVIGKSAGQIADAVGDLIIKLLEKIQELVPVIGETIGVILETILTLMEEKVPRFIEVGLLLLISFMTGIRDNIGLITTLASEILINFLDALGGNIGAIAESVTTLITNLITAIGESAQKIIDAGTAALIAFLSGITNNVIKITEAVGQMIEDFVTAVGGVANRIIDAGFATLVAFLWGLTDNVTYLTQEVGKMFDQIIGAISDLILGDSKGNGGIIDTAIDFVKKFLDGMVDRTIDFAFYMGRLIVKLLEGLTLAIRKYDEPIREAAKELGWAVIDGMTLGLADKAKKAYDKIGEIAGNVISEAFGVFKSDSPSKVFRDLGGYAVDGLALGLSDGTSAVKASKSLAQSTVNAFGAAMAGASDILTDMDEFNPTITPVLDLTRVSSDAKNLAGLLGTAPMTASLSAQQARYLSASQAAANATQEAPATSGTTELTFVQNNYSPEALSADDIYRSTRSQVTLAKEELQIP